MGPSPLIYQIFFFESRQYFVFNDRAHGHPLRHIRIDPSDFHYLSAWSYLAFPLFDHKNIHLEIFIFLPCRRCIKCPELFKVGDFNVNRTFFLQFAFECIFGSFSDFKSSSGRKKSPTFLSANQNLSAIDKNCTRLMDVDFFIHVLLSKCKIDQM